MKPFFEDIIRTFLLLTIITPYVLYGQEKFYPPELKISDYQLCQFITKLTIAVGKRDQSFIESNLSQHVKSSFGGDDEIEEFVEFYKIDNPNSEFWFILERILTIGGGVYKEGSNEYFLPFIYSDWSDTSIDVDDLYQSSLIIGANVNLRDKPNIVDSKVIGQLDYEIVKVDWETTSSTRELHQEIEEMNIDTYSWQYICRFDGRTCGFVYWKYIYSPLGYRLGLSKESGEWKILFLVAGD